MPTTLHIVLGASMQNQHELFFQGISTHKPARLGPCSWSAMQGTYLYARMTAGILVPLSSPLWGLLNLMSSWIYPFHMFPPLWEPNISWCNCLQSYALCDHSNAIFTIAHYIWCLTYSVFLSHHLHYVAYTHLQYSSSRAYWFLLFQALACPQPLSHCHVTMDKNRTPKYNKKQDCSK